jgi:LysM repeat protein
VFLIFAVLLIVIINKNQNMAEKNQVLVIEKRLDGLEAEFTSLKIYIASKLDQAIKEMERSEQTAAKQKRPPAQKEQTDVKPKVHKIQAGDSLYLISRQYGLTIEHLRDYNNLEPNAKIYPGQELKLTP